MKRGSFKGAAIAAPALITGSEVNRWGLGIVQEINSAAMHVFARWQHLDLNLDAVSFDNTLIPGDGRKLNTSFEGLDIFQVGGVIFF